MNRFFDSSIRPLLEAARSNTIVEVGCEDGLHTSRLLTYALAHQGHLHVVDPQPSFLVEPLRRQYGSHVTFHLRISHDALPSIDPPDAVLLDGDHNWYSVIQELRLLDRRCKDWPLTFLHDVEWPYGRRDLYYVPERIPADQRQPFARSGIVRGRSELSPRGINAVFANATHEGGPRNGVLTAVEDFLDETDRKLELFIAPGNEGLGIVVDRRRLRKRHFVKALREVRDLRAGAELSPSHASTALA